MIGFILYCLGCRFRIEGSCSDVSKPHLAAYGLTDEVRGNPIAEQSETASSPDATGDRMRMIYYRQINGNTYEIVTESKKYGRVVQRVLILPEFPRNEERRR